MINNSPFTILWRLPSLYTNPSLLKLFPSFDLLPIHFLGRRLVIYLVIFRLLIVSEAAERSISLLSKY